MDSPDPESPFALLGVFARQQVQVMSGFEHIELYTHHGLLTLLWHGRPDAEHAVVCVGGALGGVLGPDGGLYHRLGCQLADQGLGVLRVGYRQPNELPMCVHDTVAAMEFARMHGAERFMTLGHSFGGAVAINAAAFFDRATVPGVVTFATQAGGCEAIERLSDRDLLYFHGTADRILPHQASEMVRMLAGAGELVLLDGADHALAPCGAEVLTRLMDHVPSVFAGTSSTS